MRRMWAIAMAAALAVTGCAQVPIDGPVNYGTREVPETEPFFPMAEGPRPGDDPRVTVQRFLAAAAAGVASDFSVAREYLTAQAAADWNPSERVVVYSTASLDIEEDEEKGIIRYRVPVSAVIDARGRMREGVASEREELEFTLTEDASGRWRISGLDDGVLISETFFNSYYRPVELAFVSPDQTTIVPELRWLPLNNTATVAAKELLAGPSSWLADAVVTGFPAGAALDVESVVVEDNVASVALTPESAGSPADRALLEQQLRVTLTSLPHVNNVYISVAGLPLSGDGSVSLSRAPVPGPVAVAIVGDRLGAWDGSDLWVVADDAGVLPADAHGVALSYDDSRVAMVVGSTVVVSTALSRGVAGLVPADLSEVDDVDEEAPVDVMDLEVVWEAQQPVAPGFDRFGWLWTLDSLAPSTLVAISPEGEVLELDVAALEGRTVQSLSVSRDGSRLVIASRTGSQQWIEVAGISRGADGLPLLVGDPVALGADVGPVSEVAWLDQSTVAALAEAEEGAVQQVWIMTVGGRVTAVETVGALTVTARNGERTLTVVSVDGDVRVRSGSAWSIQAGGVREIAYAG